MRQIYLDFNATTPIHPLVAESMRPFLDEVFGNPSSSHEYGIIARQAVEQARGSLARLLNAHADEILFTSGGTEANNLAIKGFAFAHAGNGRHIITTAVEHPAVTEVCHFLSSMGFEITCLPVDSFGMVNPDDLLRAIRPGTILASVMHANNEVGTIQPVEDIGTICMEHGIVFHCDAAQSVGKIPVDVEAMQASLLSVAGHKFYAPKGVGALYCRRGTKLWKMMHGAAHEQNMRAGTENIMSIAGMGKAAEICTMYDVRSTKRNGSKIIDDGSRMADDGWRMADQVMALRDRLHSGILEAFPSARLNGHPEKRLPNTLSLGFKDKDASVLLNGWKGIAASAGAACHAGLETISAVLLAMSVPREYALGTVRFSTGRTTTAEDIETAIDVICGRESRTQAFHSIPRIPEPQAGTEAVTTSADSKEGIKLTNYTHSLGCACKIRPQALEKILQNISRPSGVDILVGTETSDDAAVYMFSEDRAIVQTVDFIPPVVDDPYSYGAIAAANALSDVWAMGGRPLFALSIVAFPEKLIPFEVLQEIIRGATDKAAEAGIPIIGGHSIEDNEPKFGMVVCGEVHPEKIWRNSTPVAGDALILTKPLGTGIISTAVKRGFAGREAAEEASLLMSGLNKYAAEILQGYDVHACTDVTGFGLLGHLKEMLSAGGMQAELNWKDVPLIASAWDYAVARMIPGGTVSNLEFVKERLSCDPGVPDIVKTLLADAQTSGGLLAALPCEQAHEAVSKMRAAGMGTASVIGKLLPGNREIIIV